MLTDGSPYCGQISDQWETSDKRPAGDFGRRPMISSFHGSDQEGQFQRV